MYAMQLCKVLSGQKGPLSLVELGEAIGLSPGCVQQAMIPLLREGIVSSRRGIHGGYALVKKGVNVATIVAAFDGICPPVAGDSAEVARIRRKVGVSVERTLRKMKLSDI